MSKVIDVAKTQIGVSEATGHNDGAKINIYQSITGAINQPWCASFVCWCFAKAGVKLPFKPSASVLVLANQAKLAKVFYEAKASFKPQPGDIGLILNPDPNHNHTFLVESLDGLYINTIEGNLSNSVKRNRRKAFGGEVKGYIRVAH